MLLRIIPLSEGRRSGRQAVTAERDAVPARGFFYFLPIRTRAASGPRSTGTKTGPHGACLTAASFLAKRAKHLPANAAGNPVLGLSHRVEPVASAASVSAERRRAARRAARSRAWRGHWLDNAPFGAPLPCCEGLTKNLSWRRAGAQNSDAKNAPRERICLSAPAQ